MEYWWGIAGERFPRGAPQDEGRRRVHVEVKVQSLGLDRSTNSPVVILQEVAGERVLPIWIGPGEASAIATQMADMAFARPLTHDLLVAVLRELGGILRKVVITRVEQSTYYAELVLERDGDMLTLDARPSDSIAVALRTGARIYAADDLLELAAIEVSDEESPAGGASPEPQWEPEPETRTPSPARGGMDPEQLKEHLRSMNPEDFGRFKP